VLKRIPFSDPGGRVNQLHPWTHNGCAIHPNEGRKTQPGLPRSPAFNCVLEDDGPMLLGNAPGVRRQDGLPSCLDSILSIRVACGPFHACQWERRTFRCLQERRNSLVVESSESGCVKRALCRQVGRGKLSKEDGATYLACKKTNHGSMDAVRRPTYGRSGM